MTGLEEYLEGVALAQEPKNGPAQPSAAPRRSITDEFLAQSEANLARTEALLAQIERKNR